MSVDFDDIDSMLSKERSPGSAIKEVHSAVSAVSQIANSNDIVTTIAGVSRLAHTIDAVIEKKPSMSIDNKVTIDEPMLRLEDIEDFVNGDDKAKEHKEPDQDKEKDNEDDKREERKEDDSKKDEAALEEYEKFKDQLNVENDANDKEEKSDSKETEEKEIADKEEVDEQEEKEEGDNSSDESSDSEESEEKDSETEDNENEDEKEDESEGESEESEEDNDEDSSEDESEDDIDDSDNEDDVDDEEQENEDEDSDDESENDDEEETSEEEEDEPSVDEEPEIEESDNEDSQEPETDEFVFDDKEDPEDSEEPEEFDEQDTDIEEAETDNEDLQENDEEEKPDNIEETEESDDEKDDKEDFNEPEDIEEDNENQESEDEPEEEESEDSDEEEDDESDSEEAEEPEQVEDSDDDSENDSENDDIDEEEQESESDQKEDVQESDNSDFVPEEEVYDVDLDEFVVFNQDVPDIDIVDLSEDIDIDSDEIPDLDIGDNIPHEIVSPSQVKDIANLASGKTDIAELGKEKVVQEIKSVAADAIASATGIPAPVIEAVMESIPKALGITAPMMLPVLGLDSAFDKAEDMVILDSEHIPSQDRFAQELDSAVNEYCEAASGGETGDMEYASEGYDDEFMAEVIDDPSHYDMSQQGFDSTVEDEKVIDFSIEEGPTLTDTEKAVDPFEYETPQQDLTYEEPVNIETSEIESDSTDAHENWVDVVADVWGWFEEKLFDTPEDEQWSEYWRDGMHNDFDDSLFRVEEYFWFGIEHTSTIKPGNGPRISVDGLNNAHKTITSIKDKSSGDDLMPAQEKSADAGQELLSNDGLADIGFMDNMPDGQSAELEILRENEAREQEQMQLREIERMVNSLNFDISSDLTYQVNWDMERIAADLFDEPVDMGDIEDMGMDREFAAIMV